MAGLPHRDSDRLTSGLALAGATHRSPTSVLSHRRRGWRLLADMTECRGSDAAMAFKGMIALLMSCSHTRCCGSRNHMSDQLCFSELWPMFHRSRLNNEGGPDLIKVFSLWDLFVLAFQALDFFFYYFLNKGF